MRQANSTIKGYLYQFNKSIWEVLNAKDDAHITLEGVIEDIDILSPNSLTTIQCKYHEDKKFQISNVAEPILEMLCHFHECAAIGKNIRYILYAYYDDNVESIDKQVFKDYIISTANKDIQLDFYHRIYTIPNKQILEVALKVKRTKADKQQLLDYYEKNRGSLKLSVDFNKFWECFKFYKAEKYEVLVQKIVDTFSKLADKEIAKTLYYPNAFAYISYISSKQDVKARTITKKQFLDFLSSQKSVLISKWLLESQDKASILKYKRTYLSSLFAPNSDVRAFVFCDKFLTANKDHIIPFIVSYLNKYFKKPKLQKPPIFIFSDKSEVVMQDSILGLYKYQKYVNTGLLGKVFVLDSFINDSVPNKADCKVTMLKNVDSDVFEKCKINQLYLIGNIKKNLNSRNYITEYLDIENIKMLEYLVGIVKTLEV